MTGARKPGPTEPTLGTEHRATGIYLCRCGQNLGELVRLGPLGDPSAWPGAADVAVHDVLCSPEGKAWLAARIRERGLERVVMGACSPREHEATFRGVLAAVGRSPEHLQLVNLREQVEWIGGNPAAATEHARRLLAAGLARVRLHQPIPAADVAVSPDVVVVGGGVAGVTAARALSRRDRNVVLVERTFALGGLANRLDEIFPGGECASCFVEPVLDEVLHSERVEVLTGAEVRRVRGAHGRFQIEIAIAPRGVDPARCLGCGACSAACPVARPDPDGGPARKAIGLPYPGALPHASAIDAAACLRGAGEACDACARACPLGAVHLDELPRTREVTAGAIVIATGMQPGEVNGPEGVVSSYALERMLHPDGPTRGEVRGPDGRAPGAVLLATTATEDDGPLAVEEILKLAARLRAKLPAARIAIAGGLHRMPGAARRVAALAADGVELLAGALEPGELEPCGDGVRARLSDGSVRDAALVAIHAPARAADGAAALAKLLHLGVGGRGFLTERGASPFEPTATRLAGIYVVGAAAGPRPIREAIRDGAAAAGLVLASLIPGDRLPLEPLAAEIDLARCGGCAVCITACPFGAIALDGAGRAAVAAIHCRGCGTCVAACPAGAATAPHFTGAQIAAEITALLRAPAGGG